MGKLKQVVQAKLFNQKKFTIILKEIGNKQTLANACDGLFIMLTNLWVCALGRPSLNKPPLPSLSLPTLPPAVSLPYYMTQNDISHLYTSIDIHQAAHVFACHCRDQKCTRYEWSLP